MKKNIIIGVLGLFVILGFAPKSNLLFSTENKNETVSNADNMKLGAFSMSLAVKDLKASKTFYEKMGFTQLGGDMASNYVILKNENAIIGLFQGMFEGNILTFNPGWDENGKEKNPFNDVREIEKHLKTQNVSLLTETDPKAASGPASIMFNDPDGNLILIDQHR